MLWQKASQNIKKYENITKNSKYIKYTKTKYKNTRKYQQFGSNYKKMGLGCPEGSNHAKI